MAECGVEDGRGEEVDGEVDGAADWKRMRHRGLRRHRGWRRRVTRGSAEAAWRRAWPMRPDLPVMRRWSIGKRVCQGSVLPKGYEMCFQIRLNARYRERVIQLSGRGGRSEFQISDFRSQISDFRSQIRFQISDFRFQISDFRFQISDFGFQISLSLPRLGV
jgi:hypothetical protein